GSGTRADSNLRRVVIRSWRRVLLLALGLVGCQDIAESPFPATSPQPFFVTETSPARGAQGVATDVAIEVRLSDVPFPPSLERAWRLSTGNISVTGEGRVDLVTPSVRIRAARGLLPRLTYWLELESSLQSFAGRPLTPFHSLPFMTGD